LISVHDLLAARQRRRGLLDKWNLTKDGIHIFNGKGLHPAISLPNTASSIASRGDEYSVGSHGCNALLHFIVCALSDAHHGDHGADANDDPEHRQR